MSRKFEKNRSDLFEAFELVAVGGKEKKDRVMSDKERKIVSYHEVGHALVSALQKNTEPVQKITIVPRTMGALGYTLQTPEEEKYLETKDELLAKITTYMAGRAAEDLPLRLPASEDSEPGALGGGDREVLRLDRGRAVAYPVRGLLHRVPEERPEGAVLIRRDRVALWRLGAIASGWARLWGQSAFRLRRRCPIQGRCKCLCCGYFGGIVREM